MYICINIKQPIQYLIVWFAWLPHWHNDPVPSPVNLYKWYVPLATGHAYIATPLAAAEAIAVYLACDWSTPGSHCLDAAASIRFTLPGWTNRSICLCVCLPV